MASDCSSFVSILRMCSNLSSCTVPVGFFFVFGRFVSSVYEEFVTASKNAKSYCNNFLNKRSTFTAMFSASWIAQQRGGGHNFCDIQVFHINTCSSSWCNQTAFPLHSRWNYKVEHSAYRLIQGFAQASEGVEEATTLWC